MAEDPVTVARTMFEGFLSNDPDTSLALIHQDIEWTPSQDEPETATLRGKEEVIGMLLKWAVAFDDFRPQPLEFIAADECVVVPLRISGRVKGGGAEVTTDETMVLWFRDGKVAEVREFRTKSEALAVAGLTLE
jgi:ketosteroid isomerase-like protein